MVLGLSLFENLAAVGLVPGGLDDFFAVVDLSFVEVDSGEVGSAFLEVAGADHVVVGDY